MMPKSRAWDKTRNEWSDGFFIYSEGGLYTPNYGFDRKHLKNRTDVYPIVKQERFILMLSSGIKDRNGIEIFESDVVSWIDNGILLFGVVEFTKGMFLVNGDEPISEEMEVIGNIYEHPDLVED